MTDLFERVLLPVGDPDVARATCDGPATHAPGRVVAVHVIERAAGAPDEASIERREDFADEISMWSPGNWETRSNRNPHRLRHGPHRCDIRRCRGRHRLPNRRDASKGKQVVQTVDRGRHPVTDRRDRQVDVLPDVEGEEAEFGGDGDAIADGGTLARAETDCAENPDGSPIQGGGTRAVPDTETNGEGRQ